MARSFRGKDTCVILSWDQERRKFRKPRGVLISIDWILYEPRIHVIRECTMIRSGQIYGADVPFHTNR